MTDAECFVCRKHREHGEMVPGGPVGEDDLVFVSHAIPGKEPAYLGDLFVEPKRHASGLGDLTEEESRAVGWWVSRVSRALRSVAGAEYVYAAVIGGAVAHLHIHLFVRYPATPREYWWTRVTEWPNAPRGDKDKVADLVQRLREHLAASPP